MANLPGLCRFLLYRLNQTDANEINRRRIDASRNMDLQRSSACGVQVHVGNGVNAGDVYPLVIVKLWLGPKQEPTEKTSFDGQVFLDGSDHLWVKSITVGDSEGQAQWPNVHREGRTPAEKEAIGV